MLPKVATRKQRKAYKYALKRPLKGYVGRYSVREDGVLISHRPSGDRIVRGSADSYGYIVVTLCMDGKERSAKMAQLVAETFIGKCPPGMQVNHRDGVKRNNSASNLEYVTAKRNCEHRHETGLTTAQGETSDLAKLTAKDVSNIRKSKRGSVELGNIYGVHYSTIWKIRSRRIWKYAP